MSETASESINSLAITGSHGTVGQALVAQFTADGYRVRRMVRGEPGPDEIGWSPADGRLDPAALAEVDGVIHLAGESIEGRWTAGKMQRIRESRLAGTKLLAGALAQVERGPRVLVSVSGVNYYGDRGDDVVDETTPRGQGFLAELAEAWETAAQPAAEAGVRVVHPRLGLVLSRGGGALKRMLPAFRMGLGGRLGDGRQWMSWVTIDDVIEAVRFALTEEQLTGPFNLVAPNPVTNEQFTQTLAQVLSRPAALPVPASLLRLAVGSLADEALLASVRAEPAKLEQSGFSFGYPQLEPALRHLLGKEHAAGAAV